MAAQMNGSMSRRAAGVLAVLLALAACENSPSDQEGEAPRALTLDEVQVSHANTLFGLVLFRQVHQQATEANVMISPLSASMALGMTANGAEGETLEAMYTTLGFGSMPQDSVNAAYRGLIAQLRARDRKVEFTLANSIWHERTFAPETDFLYDARQSFDAEVRGIDFRDAAAPRTISRWAEDATGGRIKDLIQQIDPLEIMFLVNAVYFKAPWTHPFNPDRTRPGSFRRLNGTTVSTPMMSEDASWPVLQAADADVVELLYADSAFSMVVVAPAAGKTLDDVVASLSADRWQQWLNGLRPGRIILTMPKFRFDFGQRLDPALKAMGMGIAFDANRADFDRITRLRDDLYLTRVEHKTFIDVHELGTEAAAATAVGVGVTSLPPQITIDRPFLFVIRERSSGTLLFIGRVGDPTAS
jgi:serpin B